MPTKIISFMDTFEPEHLLNIIETSPQSFGPGRRNDDMVNWFLAKAMTRKGPGKRDWTKLEMQAEFEGLMNDRLTTAQRISLKGWDEDPIYKIEILYAYYGGKGVEEIHLMSLWLPMDYEVPEA